MLFVCMCTWFVRHARWEEKALLCSSSSCQGPLIVRKHWDHKRRHVTLDLRHRERERQEHRRGEQKRENLNAKNKTGWLNYLYSIYILQHTIYAQHTDILYTAKHHLTKMRVEKVVKEEKKKTCPIKKNAKEEECKEKNVGGRKDCKKREVNTVKEMQEWKIGGNNPKEGHRKSSQASKEWKMKCRKKKRGRKNKRDGKKMKEQDKKGKKTGKKKWKAKVKW